MLITSALLGLFVGERQGHPNDHEVKVLLVASKIHELLIVVSLSSLLQYRIRHALLRAPLGLPLGLMASPFQLNDPLCLFHCQFLSTAKKHVQGPVRVYNNCSGPSQRAPNSCRRPKLRYPHTPRLDWWRLSASGLEVGDSTTAVHRLFYSAFPSKIGSDYGLLRTDHPRPPATDQFRDLHLSMLASLDLLVKASAPNEPCRAKLCIPQESLAGPL